jgi:glucose-1-phosphate thymidylyltransferase
MKVIIPMAGMGKRLRPHTLTIPKPLLPIAGKPIVQRLVEDLAKSCEEKIEELAFIIGDFGAETEKRLHSIAETIGAKASIYYQKEALGTGHAILCAKNSLQGKVIVAFADTLFKADFQLDDSQEGIIWVKQIDDPSAFGVVKLDNNDSITDFIEKPTTFVSDLAIIGIYFFKDGDYLRKALEYVVDNDLKDKGEYQLTTALENMKEKGTEFKSATVSEWLDCGNKDATVLTNQRILDLHHSNDTVSDNNNNNNCEIIEPCYIGENVQLKDSKIGPFVSIGDNCEIVSSVITNSIIQTNTKVTQARIDNSMIGNFVEFHGSGTEDGSLDLSIGDYSIIK